MRAVADTEWKHLIKGVVASPVTSAPKCQDWLLEHHLGGGILSFRGFKSGLGEATNVWSQEAGASPRTS